MTTSYDILRGLRGCFPFAPAHAGAHTHACAREWQWHRKNRTLPAYPAPSTVVKTSITQIVRGVVMVPSRRSRPPRPVGNSRERTQTSWRLSQPRASGPRTRPVGPWGNGRRQGVQTYVSVAPLALGGVSARLGAKGRGVVARRLCVTQPAWVVDATRRPDTLDETEDMEVRREHRT